ncbi:MAG: hypothetical protein HRT58_06845 [Crocinitomicaceae bacterium]|nr:hypothetical protein [Flavobacteriales bacterium]NQZ35364.1 hypothetical protein [Crocinitomicaceae bacterium]
MKKYTTLRIITIVLLNLSTFSLFAQNESTKKIAISQPMVTGMETAAITTEKMLRIEFSKLNLYYVYDEFDMTEAIENNPKFKSNCQSKTCLTELGKQLNVDFAVSGSFDKLGNKIVISLKMVDVAKGDVVKTAMLEFDDQELELQRMTRCAVRFMHGLEIDKSLTDRLYFRDEPATLNNIGRIKNSGPRIGYALMTGDLMEFATRSESQGGLDIFPAISMIGYQFEKQYIGTENFSALFEFIPNISGLEQGKFIPTMSFLNGFRFGKAGWEIAFGPGVGLKQTSKGFFDTEGKFGNQGNYMSETDWNNYAFETYGNDSTYAPNGYYQTPDPSQFNDSYNFDKRFGDKRGKLQLTTNFLFAFGRTFRAGSLNIPVNLFYSAKSGGGIAGINVGFNVIKAKTSVKKQW